jgi:hypothetical protein
VLVSRWLVVGAALAVLGALPYGVWQLGHGLPQLQLARSIAHSGAEGGRIGFIPFQLVLIGPLLIWRNVCQVSSVHAPLGRCRCRG